MVLDGHDADVATSYSQRDASLPLRLSSIIQINMEVEVVPVGVRGDASTYLDRAWRMRSGKGRWTG